jgi:hypothetical protein
MSNTTKPAFLEIKVKLLSQILYTSVVIRSIIALKVSKVVSNCKVPDDLLKSLRDVSTSMASTMFWNGK